jgi:hypothetical protein
MRTGLPNLAIQKWIRVAYSQAAPKDASGKPEDRQMFTESEAQG